MIPKLTKPEVKFIRTLEGVIVVFSNGALVLIPIVTNSLSAATAVKYGVILNGVAVVSRSILKAIMSLGKADPQLQVNTSADKPAA